MTLRKVVADLARGMECDDDWKPDWGVSISTQLGSFLLNLSIESCILPISERSVDDPTVFIKKNVRVFEHAMMRKDQKQVGIVKFHPSLFDLLVNSIKYVAPWSLPMVVMPLPWVTSTSGGYITHRFSLVRTNGNDEHVEYIKAADEMGHLSTMMRSLDVLGSTPWRVNRKILKVATQFWNNHIALPCLPTDNVPDPIPIPSDMETNQEAKKKYKREVAKRNQLIANIFSERCSANYKLDIARAVFLHNVVCE
jgi:DNA-directed RNA polymerase, mitochondrial